MDHDRLFKQLLSTFFMEFMDAFFTEFAEQIDRRSVTFLDKEIFTDVASGERHEVDLLVKAKYRSQDVFFLIHVENQSTHQRDYPQRMFRYFARIFEKFRLPIYPVAVLSYDTPRTPAPDQFRIEFLDGLVLDFRYRVVQLNRFDWRAFLNNPNPASTALMAKMNIAPEDRPRVRFEMTRMIAKMKLDKARSTLIGTFMTNYLKLTPAEYRVYNQYMATLRPKEKEEVLVLTNPWIEEGIERGKEQGAQSTVMRILTRRFGVLPLKLRKQIQSLAARKLDKLADALLDFTDLAHLKRWLAKNA